jgi:PE-PPE domain-containing protein
MRSNRSICAGAAVAVVATGVVVSTPVTPAPIDIQARAVRLVDVDTAASPLGDGTALIYGGSGIPIPGQLYMDAANQLYLQPNGFTGTLQSEFIPNELRPFTGMNSLGFGSSLNQDQPIMISEIENQIAAGGVSPDHPVVVFGYSQSSDAASLIMQQLHDDGVPADDLHFVLVGDTNNPVGGVVSLFDFPAGNTGALSALDFPFQPATPSDLYPTDIYSIEYDSAPDFPQYSSNLLSDLNADLGFFFEHTAYLQLTPELIASAQLLPGSQDSAIDPCAACLTDYYMIPNDNLPLLEPLLLIPGAQPLYDLLEPDARILVNLGYGSITEGWNQEPANVPIHFAASPPSSVLDQVPSALATGWQQGVTAFMNDLAHPISYQDQLAPLMPFVNLMHTVGLTPENPSFTEFINAFLAYSGFPLPNLTAGSSPADIVDAITKIVSYDYTSLSNFGDAINNLVTSLPAYDSEIFTSLVAAGDFTDAILDPMAANTALIPLDIINGAGPLLALLGTAVSLGQL